MSIYDIPSFTDRVKGNSYVGRGIVVGMTPDGQNAVSAYFIMGRSENSRNRIFVKKNDAVLTEPFDCTKVEDPSLIIYAAVRAHANQLIVTNGDQTDTVYDFLCKGDTFEHALETREFEPDAPNLTPRISALLSFANGSFTYKMSILKSEDAQGSACMRTTYSYQPLKGLGHFIHTYLHDGNPIPSFTGEPERVAIVNDIDTLTKEIWDGLDEGNKISLYVRYTNLKDGAVTERLINKNSEGGC